MTQRSAFGFVAPNKKPAVPVAVDYFNPAMASTSAAAITISTSFDDNVVDRRQVQRSERRAPRAEITLQVLRRDGAQQRRCVEQFEVFAVGEKAVLDDFESFVVVAAVISCVAVEDAQIDEPDARFQREKHAPIERTFLKPSRRIIIIVVVVGED